jgi:hypothetical protein
LLSAEAIALGSKEGGGNDNRIISVDYWGARRRSRHRFYYCARPSCYNLWTPTHRSCRIDGGIVRWRIDRLGRGPLVNENFRDEAAVRAVLLSTAIAEAISLVFVVQATLAGTMNAMGWVAALIYLFGAAGCTYILMTQKRLAAV